LKNEYNQKYVLNSSDKDFDATLNKLAAELGATVYIDPVAGDLTGKVMSLMPPGSTSLVYGALSSKGPCGLNPLALIGMGQTIQGFVLGEFIKYKGKDMMPIIGKSMALQKVKAFQPTIQKKFPLSKFQDSVKEYLGNMTGGKFVLCPHMEDAALVDGAEFPEFDLYSPDGKSFEPPAVTTYTGPKIDKV